MKIRPIIAVIGEGDVEEGSLKYGLAFDLGKALIDNGYRIITGGYGGVMEAASRGARASEAHRPGDILGMLPSRSIEGANPYIDIVIPSGLGVMRNAIIANSDAVIAVGGGAGTLSEMALAWQFGKLIIGYRVDGWSGRLADEKIDDRVRFGDARCDRVLGADSKDDVISLLSLHLDHCRAN